MENRNCIFFEECQKEGDWYGVHYHNFGGWLCEGHKDDGEIEKSSVTHIDELDTDWLLKDYGVENEGKENGISFGYQKALSINPDDYSNGG